MQSVTVVDTSLYLKIHHTSPVESLTASHIATAKLEENWSHKH